MGKKPLYSIRMSIYKGEGRYLIIPIIRHISGLHVNGKTPTVLEERSSPEVLGRYVKETIDFVEKSEVDSTPLPEIRRNPTYKAYTKYKGQLSFWKHNYVVDIKVSNDFECIIESFIRSNEGFYNISAKKYEMSVQASEFDIGTAVINAFRAVEEYYKKEKSGDSTLANNIELIDGSRLTFYAPNDYRFTDEQDAHAAEIYQAYSYATNEGDDPFAYMYLGIAAELNCNISKEHIESVWTRLYGELTSFSVKEGEFGIFTHRAEFKNKDNRVISYLKQMSDDLLLDCTLVIESPGRHTRAIKTLVKAHDKLMSDCKFVV